MAKDEFPKKYLYRRIVHAKMFIDAHYAEQINLSYTADQSLFSKFHFIRIFKSIYGTTPHQYLTSVRIEKAKLLLRTEMSISQVCNTVGFESLSSFSGLFRKIVGQSPSAYHVQQLQWLASVAKNPLHYIPNCFAEKKGWSEFIENASTSPRSKI
ncbi:MAG: AraC family transcriptional regulator [Saprospiraceae bacterium]